MNLVNSMLLQTKLTPPLLRGPLLDRADLADRLRHVTGVPLTLLSAPAGFGKTTAARQTVAWLTAHANVSAAWLSLHREDDLPAHFWRYVGAALKVVGAPDGGLLDELSGPQPLPIQVLLVQWLNHLAAHPTHVLLVLDDYHHIADQAIHDQLTFVLEHAPANLHLLLTTRADPPLPLHRLRMQARLLEIRAADLRVSHADATRMLEQHLGDSISPREIDRLVERTEGWVAGLHLAALAIKGAPTTGASHDRTALIERLVQSNRYIVDYLTEEVLNQQSAAVRDFLLDTSILRELSGDLCDAVTQRTDSTALLSALAAENVFIVDLEQPTTRDAQHWVRYHTLFADLLRGHLQRRSPSRLPALHHRAAEWYAAHDQPVTAIEHALHGDDPAFTVRLIERHARHMVMQGGVTVVEGWLQRLPDEWRFHLPGASLAFAWALLLRGQYAAMEQHLQHAEAALPDAPALRGEYLTLRASLADTLGEPDESRVLAQQALEAVSNDDVVARASAQVALAGSYRELGDVQAAADAYERAIPLCRAAHLPVPEMLSRAHLGYLSILCGQLRRAEAVARPAIEAQHRHPAVATVHALLASILIERDELASAAEHLEIAQRLAQRSGHNATLVNIATNRARIAMARHQLDDAQHSLEDAATHFALGAPAWLQPVLLAEQVRLWLAQGAPSRARHALAGADASLRGHTRDFVPLSNARLSLYESHPEQLAHAVQIARSLEQDASRGGRLGIVLPALLVQAHALGALGERPAALVALDRALDLAHPEGALRGFLDAGEPIHALLAHSSHPFARAVLARLSPQPTGKPAPQPLIEPLTERELEVLAAMARGLTYQQIADELIVSLNTVRHHVKSVYGKLQVNKATLAVEKAQHLNLL